MRVVEGVEHADDRLQRLSDAEPLRGVGEKVVQHVAATVRRRRLPVEEVVWVVLGMALFRDRPIEDVVSKLDLALPGGGGTVAKSSVSHARTRLGSEPMKWLFERSASAWAHASAAAHRWRGLALYGIDGSSLRVPDTSENREHFGGQAGRKGSESGYPMARVVALMVLRSHPARGCLVRALRR